MTTLVQKGSNGNKRTNNQYQSTKELLKYPKTLTSITKELYVQFNEIDTLGKLGIAM